jgi:3-phosphoshikimate 1-carboxyvinyltransferase
VSAADRVTIQPARRVTGRVTPPGDKSISHRYAMLAALADGPSVIERYAPGADCQATLACLGGLGVAIAERAEPSGAPAVRVMGRGLRGLAPAEAALDARNAGTTLRLLSGIVAAHRFVTTLTGDASLCRRPMARVIDPLTRMGARIDARDGCPPLTITGADLRAIAYTTKVPSAQVKSAILLAGLQAVGTTSVTEPASTRNHTELALAAFGADVATEGTTVTVRGMQPLRGAALRVPGDPSSAAFWAVAAAGLPGSDIEIADVGLNPTRIAFLEVLRRAGAQVEATIAGHTGGEAFGTLRVRCKDLRPIVLDGSDIPALIDELPALAALATFGGQIDVRGASELRVKESDRISCLVSGLRGLGADVEERPDGFVVRGRRRLAGGTADAAGDHRLAMSFAIAALGARGPCTVTGAASVAVSYPGFFDVLRTIVDE